LFVPAAEDALHDKGISFAGIEATLFKQCVDLFEIVGEFEDGFDAATVLAGADEIVVGAFSENKFQRAYDHGFSGPGCSGDTDEPRTEFPSEIVDECEIFDF
jgi:hypothetical protein